MYPTAMPTSCYDKIKCGSVCQAKNHFVRSDSSRYRKLQDVTLQIPVPNMKYIQTRTRTCFMQDSRIYGKADCEVARHCSWAYSCTDHVFSFITLVGLLELPTIRYPAGCSSTKSSYIELRSCQPAEHLQIDAKMPETSASESSGFFRSQSQLLTPKKRSRTVTSAPAENKSKASVKNSVELCNNNSNTGNSKESILTISTELPERSSSYNTSRDDVSYGQLSVMYPVITNFKDDSRPGTALGEKRASGQLLSGIIPDDLRASIYQENEESTESLRSKSQLCYCQKHPSKGCLSKMLLEKIECKPSNSIPAPQDVQNKVKEFVKLLQESKGCSNMASACRERRGVVKIVQAALTATSVPSDENTKSSKSQPMEPSVRSQPTETKLTSEPSSESSLNTIRSSDLHSVSSITDKKPLDTGSIKSSTSKKSEKGANAPIRSDKRTSVQKLPKLKDQTSSISSLGKVSRKESGSGKEDALSRRSPAESKSSKTSTKSNAGVEPKKLSKEGSTSITSTASAASRGGELLVTINASNDTTASSHFKKSETKSLAQSTITEESLTKSGGSSLTKLKEEIQNLMKECSLQHSAITEKLEKKIEALEKAASGKAVGGRWDGDAAVAEYRACPFEPVIKELQEKIKKVETVCPEICTSRSAVKETKEPDEPYEVASKREDSPEKMPLDLEMSEDCNQEECCPKSSLVPSQKSIARQPSPILQKKECCTKPPTKSKTSDEGSLKQNLKILPRDSSECCPSSKHKKAGQVQQTCEHAQPCSSTCPFESLMKGMQEKLESNKYPSSCYTFVKELQNKMEVLESTVYGYQKDKQSKHVCRSRERVPSRLPRPVASNSQCKKCTCPPSAPVYPSSPCHGLDLDRIILPNCSKPTSDSLRSRGASTPTQSPFYSNTSASSTYSVRSQEVQAECEDTETDSDGSGFSPELSYEDCACFFRKDDSPNYCWHDNYIALLEKRIQELEKKLKGKDSTGACCLMPCITNDPSMPFRRRSRSIMRLTESSRLQQTSIRTTDNNTNLLEESLFDPQPVWYVAQTGTSSKGMKFHTFSSRTRTISEPRPAAAEKEIANVDLGTSIHDLIKEAKEKKELKKREPFKSSSISLKNFFSKSPESRPKTKSLIELEAMLSLDEKLEPNTSNPMAAILRAAVMQAINPRDLSTQIWKRLEMEKGVHPKFWGTKAAQAGLSFKSESNLIHIEVDFAQEAVSIMGKTKNLVNVSRVGSKLKRIDFGERSETNVEKLRKSVNYSDKNQPADFTQPINELKMKRKKSKTYNDPNADKILTEEETRKSEESVKIIKSSRENNESKQSDANKAEQLSQKSRRLKNITEEKPRTKPKSPSRGDLFGAKIVQLHPYAEEAGEASEKYIESVSVQTQADPAGRRGLFRKVKGWMRKSDRDSLSTTIETDDDLSRSTIGSGSEYYMAGPRIQMVQIYPQMSAKCDVAAITSASSEVVACNLVSEKSFQVHQVHAAEKLGPRTDTVQVLYPAPVQAYPCFGSSPSATSTKVEKKSGGQCSERCRGDRERRAMFIPFRPKQDSSAQTSKKTLKDKLWFITPKAMAKTSSAKTHFSRSHCSGMSDPSTIKNLEERIATLDEHHKKVMKAYKDKVSAAQQKVPCKCKDLDDIQKEVTTMEKGFYRKIKKSSGIDPREFQPYDPNTPKKKSGWCNRGESGGGGGKTEPEAPKKKKFCLCCQGKNALQILSHSCRVPESSSTTVQKRPCKRCQCTKETGQKHSTTVAHVLVHQTMIYPIQLSSIVSKVFKQENQKHPPMVMQGELSSNLMKDRCPSCPNVEARPKEGIAYRRSEVFEFLYESKESEKRDHSWFLKIFKFFVCRSNAI